MRRYRSCLRRKFLQADSTEDNWRTNQQCADAQQRVRGCKPHAYQVNPSNCQVPDGGGRPNRLASRKVLIFSFQYSTYLS